MDRDTEELLKDVSSTHVKVAEGIQSAVHCDNTRGGRSERKISEVISLGQSKYLDTFNLRGDADIVNTVGHLNDIVKANLRVAPTVATKIIYCVGLEILASALQDTESIEDKLDDVLTAKYIEILEKQRRFKKLETLYKAMSPEDFIMFCADNNISDYQEFLEMFTWRNQNIKETTRRILWLRDYLLSNDGHASASSVQIAANAAGIATDEKAWGTLKMFASRLGITSSYGTWTWSEQAQERWEKVTM